jgi:hypothetical protein
VRLRSALWRQLPVIGVVALVILSGIAIYLALRPGAPAPVMVVGFSWHFIQGNDTGGGPFNDSPSFPWFGRGMNTTGASEGYPFAVTPGGTVTIGLILVNTDTKDHPIYSLALTPSSLSVSTSDPPFPATFEDGEDVDIFITIQVNGAPGSSVWGVGTFDALG